MVASIFHNASCTSVRYGPWFHLCGAMVALLSVLEWNSCGSMSLICQSQTDGVFTCRRELQWSVRKPRRYRKVQINAGVFLILHADVHCELDFDSSSSFVIMWEDLISGWFSHRPTLLIEVHLHRPWPLTSVIKVRLRGKSLNYTKICFHSGICILCERFALPLEYSIMFKNILVFYKFTNIDSKNSSISFCLWSSS